MFKALRNSLYSLFFPQECRMCRRHVDDHDDGRACSDCWAETTIFTGKELLCARCGAFFGESDIKIDAYCHKCDGHYYDRAVAAGVYEKALAATIIGLKSQPHISLRARDIFYNSYLNANFPSPDLIIPVPLSKHRRSERSFNQADLLGGIIAKKAGIEFDRHSLIRVKHTPIHRIAMDQKAREQTVRDAFSVVRPNLITDRSILLVDDVFTSGATTSNCAKVLKKNGAVSVNVLTLARAVLH